MNPVESKWFQSKLSKYIGKGATILNLGSGTKFYREQVAPHIEEDLFKPLAEKGVRVIHVDLKNDEGVDLVGDLTDPGFMKRLREYRATAVICSNILEHLEERDNFCNGLINVLISNGFIFASVPRQYPFHPDPIDTMFRPDVNELVNQFPGAAFVEGEILECGTFRDKNRYYRENTPKRWLLGKVKRILKLFLPFYKPRKWFNLILGRDRLDPDTPISVTCVVLTK